MATFPYGERFYGTQFADLAVYIPYVVRGGRTNSLSRIAGTMFVLMVVQIVLQAGIAVATRNRTSV